MSSDRTYRSLQGLERTASTSRVLNLAALAQKYGDDPEHRAAPFFTSPALSAAVIIKHRVRADEATLFKQHVGTATKLIIPFERTDLSLGGRAVLVGENGWEEKLKDLRESTTDSRRDIAVLEALDELPSLDPFLLREHLRRRGFTISPTHFAISPSDLERMQRFVGREIARLIDLAYAEPGGGERNTARLVTALLCSASDDRLEPLRLTLRLEGASYKEGMFCWKGFLYYKWALDSILPELKQVMRELYAVRLTGPRDATLESEINTVRDRLRRNIEAQMRIVTQQLAIYDNVFDQLTGKGDVLAFRDFLLNSPNMFSTLGHGCGAVAHIASYWRYRFPRKRLLRAAPGDLLEILYDFEAGIGGPQMSLAA